MTTALTRPGRISGRGSVHFFGYMLLSTGRQLPVELIGPVNAPGTNGPTNGMYALQKALRKHIA